MRKAAIRVGLLAPDAVPGHSLSRARNWPGSDAEAGGAAQQPVFIAGSRHWHADGGALCERQMS
jgi:hypothetical protein